MATILLVEDEDGERQMLALNLETAGHSVLQASEGSQALRILEQTQPDLILTDVLMPQMDGFAFCKSLKENTQTRHIPVIILTARGKMEDAFEALGVDGFLEKPTESVTLLSTINAALSQPKKGGRLKQTPQRFLIFGTYPEVCESMISLLQSRGFQVQTAATASDILVHVVNFHPDIIILEVQLEDGKPLHDVIKAIRLFERHKETPILMYSYYRVSDLASAEFRKRAIAIERSAEEAVISGATEYLDRFNDQSFLDLLAKYL